MALLDYFPKPLIEDFLERRWLPIVGAGFSKNAVLPKGQAMPDWRELGDSLAADLADYEVQDAIDAVSAFEDRYDRARLVERLSQLLHTTEARPGRAHAAFCALAFNVVVTTNFDFLLEHQYSATWPPCLPVLDESQLSQRAPDDQTQLLKLHGDLHHPTRLVATEEDYDRFLARNPLIATYFANLLITRTPVLVGYSLSDADLRSVWSLVRDRLGTLQRKAYVIQVGASPTEVARFARRGVEVVSLPKGDPGAVLADAFKELRDLWEARAPDYGQATEDEVAGELVLPPNTPSRLCYCSVPVRLMAWYRREVFPVIERAGYITVTRDEFVGPGDIALAKVQALLARSQLALIDISSFGTAYELNAATEALGPERVIAVADDGATLPASVRRRTWFMAGPRDLDHPDEFLEELRVRLSQQTPERADAGELYSDGHYRAAIVVAVGKLEEQLLKRLNFPPAEQPPPLREILARAEANQLLTDQQRADAEEWMAARILAVHGRQEMSAEVAAQVISGAAELAEKLERQ